MARTVRNAKLDTRSARAKLSLNKSGYWVPIARGFALGYRKGSKGGMWLARLIDKEGRRETSLGPADDVLEPDGMRILDYAQAQSKAREWLSLLSHKSDSGPYTVDQCLDHYIAEYTRRGGKALSRVVGSIAAFIRPRLGKYEVDSLTATIIKHWQTEIATAPPRLRTRSP
jgi:hypothetical protein